MSLIRFEKVDVIFSKSPREALALLDKGQSRDQILKQTGQVVGVENANLEIERGEIFVLMGLSGSGKSSLLRCINGLNQVSRGRIVIEHEGQAIDIVSCSPATLKMMRTKRIAMVFQKFALMPWLTVRENISFGLEMQGRSADECRKLSDAKLELVGLTQWRNKRPHELSGGMQQRVGLARALAMDADILLMDEPFSALDPLIRQQLQDELLVLQRQLQKTIVFVSHDLDEALKIGSRIAIMKDGKIIQHGQPEDIVLNPVDEYVRMFVAHTNPLNVLCGRSLMRNLNNCTRVNGEVCLDPGSDSWLGLSADNLVLGARQGTDKLHLQSWASGQPMSSLQRQPTLVDSNIGMREALDIRYHTGQKLVLHEQNKVVGVLGDSEMYSRFAGQESRLINHLGGRAHAHQGQGECFMPKVGMQPIRRKQLIDATLTAVDQVGMHDASIALIAKLAGVSNGIISHYFQDKSGLLEATMRHLMNQLIEVQRERRLALEQDTPLLHLRTIIQSNFDDSQVNGPAMKTWLAFWASSMHQPSLQRLQRINDHRLYSNLCSQFKRALAAGSGTQRRPWLGPP